MVKRLGKSDPRTYCDGSRDGELFTLTRGQAQASTGAERIKRPPTAAWAICPLHVSAGQVRGTGLVHTGEHLTWITHWIMTGLPGHQRPSHCRGSGVTICTPGAEPVGATMRVWVGASARSEDNGHRSAACPHESARVHGVLDVPPALTELAPELAEFARWHCATCGYATTGRPGRHPVIRDGSTHTLALGWLPREPNTLTPKD
jgi:hypothetical protein